jgi:hypothetical protein
MNTFNVAYNWTLVSQNGPMLPHSGKTILEMAMILRNTWEYTGANIEASCSDFTVSVKGQKGTVTISQK